MEPELVEAIAHVLVTVFNALPESAVGHVMAWSSALSIALAIGRMVLDRWGPRSNGARAWIDAFDMLLDKAALNSKPLAHRPMRPRKEDKP